MKDVFMRSFLQARDDSCAACTIERSNDSAEYEELQKNCEQLFEEIRSKLGADGVLMEQYETTVNYRESMEEDWIYRQGFQDCMHLLKWMKAFENS